MAGAVAIRGGGETRSFLAVDEPALGSVDATATRLLGSFDPFLQAKDRATLVPGAVQARELWPVLGRPGVVLAGGGLVDTWRPPKSGRTLKVVVDPWQKLPATTRNEIVEQAERLAAYRAGSLAGVEFTTRGLVMQP
ncbi:winged helix DNA-binding domain-containing protein [Micromonospora peucetia]|uniref:DNA glycosylase AlkZ-like family protein n=1 Tax=Micromonospora peucetia TaxID=47871 RepID=UPI00224DEDEC|nr:crosslink repair DNA glycosylase YcaQ family protein [Micromonospora peucetia]MCX4388115.1 winged helix DNA-binding domain-containing protein [Micromonospora peucetia]